MSLNCSTSKQKFSFSKNRRFAKTGSLNPNISYEVKSQFSGNKRNGETNFGSTSARFNYGASPKKHGNLPSPNNYQIPSQFSPASKTISYSFGVSRSQMVKNHVDQILANGDSNQPSPSRYQIKGTFGEVNGTQYSMAAKLNHFDKQLKRVKNWPGPGAYKEGDAMGSNGYASKFKTSTSNAFGKAEDRFAPPTMKTRAPAPNVYSPRNNLNEDFNSTFRTSGRAIFGTDKTDIISKHWNHDNQKTNPGPGSYNRFSEFEQ